MNCNATIQVGSETLTCREAEPHGDGRWHRHNARFGDHEGRVFWSDGDPGATPHEDPKPRYVCEAAERPDGRTEEWRVLLGARIVARFTPHHPDQQGAGEAEAARLNGEGDAWAEGMVDRYHEAARERDAYRAALVRIANGQHVCPTCEWTSPWGAFAAGALEEVRRD